ncbi:hypothetical protein BV25DRAFT_1830379 [Artomyces pyxidatus]|uniref:Uncharacterized protein n=1 Tax=Artomyces pyxidatus TaxID=48021 RepID=A0ACB8SQZ8_9AGAM|nr:hypothetical protein BV25DRAFT_1830379 [Artomyces pyxidatus]
MRALNAIVLSCLTLLLLPTINATAASDDRAQVPFNADDSAAWDSPPHLDSTHHLIFNDVASLRQRLPNTIHLNGHSVVAVIVPTGTILYHGRGNDSAPTGSEWLAFDFEHSHQECWGPCYVISYVTTRELRLAYLDGVSAANLGSGTFDTQDILIWGKPRLDKVMEEEERIAGICEWGKKYDGLDGFVRMEFHFEVILCNFSSGSVEVVSLLNILPKDFSEFADPPEKLPPWRRPLPATAPPPGWKGSLPSAKSSDFEAMVAGSWQNRAPGETRMRVDYSSFVTFYDRTLTSLVAARRGVPRVKHRLINITASETARKLDELADVYGRAPGAGSGVDWGSVTHVVQQRYADRLALLRFLLAPTQVAAANATAHAALVRAQLLTMLAPYMTTDAVPAPGNASWAQRIVRLCATTHTARIRDAVLTPQERGIRNAVEGTAREICRQITLMWADAFDIEGAGEARQRAALLKWRGQVAELMAWLDWSVWAQCEPECRPDELCYVSTWPYIYVEDDPADMTPHCISRTKLHMQPWPS